LGSGNLHHLQVHCVLRETVTQAKAIAQHSLLQKKKKKAQPVQELPSCCNCFWHNISEWSNGEQLPFVCSTMEIKALAGRPSISVKIGRNQLEFTAAV